jgi:hypothetical protein
MQSAYISRTAQIPPMAKAALFAWLAQCVAGREEIVRFIVKLRGSLEMQELT